MTPRSLLRFRLPLVVLVHAALAAAAWGGSWFLRLDTAWFQPGQVQGVDYLRKSLEVLPWVLAARLVALGWFGLFQGLWRYVSLTDLVNLTKATVLGTLLYAPIVVALGLKDFPRSIFLIEPMVCLTLLGGVRFGIRAWREAFAPQQGGARRVVIVGAGDAGEMLLREMRAHRHLGYEPAGFVDDDPVKAGRRIHGVPVLGRVEELAEVARRTSAEEVIVAAPTAEGDLFRRALEQTAGTGLRLRRLPSTASDIVRLTGIRDVDFEDLLDREPVHIDLDRLRAAVSGRTVLVTGAGGSIGSEVVRQLAPLGAALVVALDRSENALFFLERELLVHHPLARVRVRVADCQDRGTMRGIFAEVRPDLVIHAAAYKHVPLMESHPAEAVRNNVEATRFLAELAAETGTATFLLISSDKAVNPTSVMGATKRAAELALQSVDARGTRFAAVRFGNVLGSEGSVVPLFRRQIQEGGPVTVTHPDVVRFFMTISEAVGLVLQAGLAGAPGTIFHLDMGRPVKVADLAEKLVLLSGFRPGTDIEIRYTGLRPGEKMHEELLATGEGVTLTEHPRILAVNVPAADAARLRARLDDLVAAASHGREKLLVALKVLVPEYEPQNDEIRRTLAEHAPVGGWKSASGAIRP